MIDYIEIYLKDDIVILYLTTYDYIYSKGIMRYMIYIYVFCHVAHILFCVYIIQ